MKDKVLKFVVVVFIYTITNYAFAQQIPFQGRLLQDGEPVTGSRSLVFSIADLAWTETHSNVTVSEGYYALVLGSIMPFPDSLFIGADSRSLEISVNGTALSAITIYKPFQTKVFDETSETGDTNNKTALLAYTEGVGSGNHYGLDAKADGKGLFNDAIIANAFGEGNTTESSTNSALYGTAQENLSRNIAIQGWSNGTSGVLNMGGRFVSRVNNSTATNYGLFSDAYGGQKNYGIYATTSDTSSSAENYAGYFEGDVMITGKLVLDQEINSNEPIRLYNSEDQLKLSVEIDSARDAGEIEIYGNDGVIKSFLGTLDGYGSRFTQYDSIGKIGSSLFVNAEGVGNLYTYSKGVVTGWFGNTDGGGFWQTVGFDSTKYSNGAIYAGHWQNNGLPQLILEGSAENKGDPFHTLLHLYTFNDGDSENGEIRINSSSRSLNGQPAGVLMGIDSNEAGYISLSDTSGHTLTITGDGQINTGTGIISNLLLGVKDTISSSPKAFISTDKDGKWSKLDVQGYSSNQSIVTAGVNYMRFDADTTEIHQNRGLVAVFGPEYWVGGFGSQSDNTSSESGYLELFGKNASGNLKSFINADIKNDGNGNAGNLSIQGPDKVSLVLGGKRWESNSNLGYLHLLGDTEDAGNDVRAQLEVNTVNGKTAGYFSVNGPIDNGGYARPFVQATVDNDNAAADPDGWSGQLWLYGTTSPNVEIGGKQWENNDLANISLYGRTKTSDDLWWQTNSFWNVETDNTNDWAIMGFIKTDITNRTSTTTVSIDGNAGNITTVSVTQTSDARFKRDVTPLQNTLEKVTQLRGVSYFWNQEKNISDKQQIGLIAQEVEAVFPQFVTTDKEGFKSVNYAAMVSVLIESVKELNQKIATLETENNELKTQNVRIDALEKQLSMIQSLIQQSGNQSYAGE